jgi:hypothetical protein
MLHYCVCDLLRKGPYKKSTSPFGNAGHARDRVVVFLCEGDKNVERLCVFGANSLCL